MSRHPIVKILDAAKGSPVVMPVFLQPVKKNVGIGRNDPCPCGSGKKLKHCHKKV